MAISWIHWAGTNLLLYLCVNLALHLNYVISAYWCFQVKCVEVSVAILYILLVFAFFGWSFFGRMRQRRGSGSSEEPLLNVIHDDDIDSVNLHKDESVATKVNLDISGGIFDNLGYKKKCSKIHDLLQFRSCFVCMPHTNWGFMDIGMH